MDSHRRAVLVRTARLLAGPLALAGFFGDWVDGSGVLAGHSFSGFELVAFTGSLQNLELTAIEHAALAGVRLAILGVAVVAVWQVVLAIRPSPSVNRATNLYLIVAAIGVVAAAVYQGGPLLPPGAISLLGAGICSLAGLAAGEESEPALRARRAT
ncbi:MAG: hypothetical protein ACE5EF_08105 [Dehalococcoidia bacterium]